MKDMAVVVINGKQQILRKGQSVSGGITLISANSREAIIEIEGQQRTYKLGEQIGSSFEQAKIKASLQIWPDLRGAYYVSGSINNFPVKFLVDTGATMVAMNEITGKRLGLQYRLRGKEGSASTASGVAKAWYLKLDKVKIGEIELRNIGAAVIQGNHPTEVLLGSSFLSRIHMERNGQAMILSIQ